MSVNASSSDLVYHCTEVRAAFFIATAFLITKSLLILPFAILFLYLGHQRWQQHRSFATTNHSDIFIYQVAILDIFFVLGTVLYLPGKYSSISQLMTAGFYVSNLSFSGSVLFHTMTCAERYLAVVHPVTYLRLRQSGGLRIRNMGIVCVWLLCFVWCGVGSMDFPFIPLFCLLAIALTVVSFFSLRVLCVLIRPGPGEVGGDREWAHQSKQRAFQTIMAITGAQLMWLSGILVSLSMDLSKLLDHNDGCVVMVCGYWFSLPSHLVLPSLFLHRARKRICCH